MAGTSSPVMAHGGTSTSPISRKPTSGHGYGATTVGTNKRWSQAHWQQRTACRLIRRCYRSPGDSYAACAEGRTQGLARTYAMAYAPNLVCMGHEWATETNENLKNMNNSLIILVGPEGLEPPTRRL